MLLPVLCLALGLALGLVNGFLVTRLRLLPLIATLGTFYVYSGAAVALTGGAAQAGVPAYLLPWGRGAVGGLPLPFLTLTLPLFVVAGVLLHTTSWGRWIYGMGFNERSARLVGIPVDRVRLAAYGASGALAGCAALVSLAWLGGGRPNIGQNLELTSLTAAMLGGIGIFGGRGGVFGVLAAVLFSSRYRRASFSSTSTPSGRWASSGRSLSSSSLSTISASSGERHEPVRRDDRNGGRATRGPTDCRDALRHRALSFHREIQSARGRPR